MRIPVTANGDIFTGDDAAHILRYTGCDLCDDRPGAASAIRGVFEQANAALAGLPQPELPPLAERMDTGVRQIELLARRAGERAACLEARHHLPWYLHGVPYAGYYRSRLVHVETLEDCTGSPRRSNVT